MKGIYYIVTAALLLTSCGRHASTSREQTALKVKTMIIAEQGGANPHYLYHTGTVTPNPSQP